MTKPPPTLQRPSWRTVAIATVVLSFAALYITLFTGQTTAPPQKIASLPISPATTVASPSPIGIPTVVAQTSPRQVTLSPIVLYGDYDEATQIGTAPSGLICVLSGQSPDGAWAWLDCPEPTGRVWAKTATLKLSAEQRDTLFDVHIVSRVVPTAAAFSSPPSPNSAAPQLLFCADRSSIWGKTHQCASTQEAADALADAEIGALNATAQAKRTQP